MDTAVSSEQSDSGDDVAFEKTSDTEESIPMETNQPDQISSKGSKCWQDSSSWFFLFNSEH